MRASVDKHLERYLGPIVRGWGDYAGELAGIQVCLFEDRPIPGTVTYATLGLGRHTLKMPQGREVRHELLLSVAQRFADDDLAKLLVYVAEGSLREHRALLRGQVVHLSSACAKLALQRSLRLIACRIPRRVSDIRGHAARDRVCLACSDSRRGGRDSDSARMERIRRSPRARRSRSLRSRTFVYLVVSRCSS